jgi:hypothetical protein
MQYPTWRAGQKVTSTALAGQGQTIVVASSDQGVTNSATFVDDTALTATLEANAIYLIEFGISFVITNATPDVKTEWGVPAGATGLKFTRGPTDTAGSWTSETDTRIRTDANTFGIDIPYQGSSGAFAVTEVGSVATTSSGTLVFRFAQNTATAATTTTRQSGSYLKITRFA